MKIKITDEYNNKKLLDLLRGTLGFSRAAVTALKVREDGILLNGEHVTVRAVLHTGDELSLGIEDREEDVNGHILPVDLPLDIIYEDENVVCVNKPFGMPTHPTHGHYGDTLANALAHYYGELGIPFVFRAVNRLDRDTSGVVLVAKNQAAADYLAAQVRRRSIGKTYVAVCHGVLPECGRIEGYIRRLGDSIITRGLFPQGEESEYSLTTYERLSLGDSYSVIECTPVTGRTHQIRVHLSSSGHPIYGDGLYGVEDGMGRQALHASSLTFDLPFYGRSITVSAPVADDITKLIE
ncbi:MAG: RluA family pseudouridine synthase, partial [Clostridia bacterium]|nr:RluA family pseudouridine synthase [Clostridia bacterium]